MKSLLFSLALLAVFAVGCSEPVADNPAIDQVDAAGLDFAMAGNSVTLIDFTAVW